MPFAGYEDFNECVSKVMEDKGLSEEEAKKYCGKIKAKTEKNWQFDMDIEKFAEEKDGNLYVAGYASNGDRDLDDEKMDLNSLKKAFNDYMKNPVVKFMHDKAPQWRGAVGKVVPHYTDSNGKTWYTKFDSKPFLVIKIHGSEKLQWLKDMVKDEMVKGLSIGGKGNVDDDGTIHVKSWLETSLVDVPSATGSFVKVLKMACIGDNCPFSKEEDSMTEEEEKTSVEQRTIVNTLTYMVNNPGASRDDIATALDMNKSDVDSALTGAEEMTGKKITKKNYMPEAIAVLAKNADGLTVEDIAKDYETGAQIADTINKICGVTVVKSRAKTKIDKFVANTNI